MFSVHKKVAMIVDQSKK